MDYDNFEWYKVVNSDEPLAQGDIILNCPIVQLEKVDVHPFFKPFMYDIDAIVMTQACDLAQKKVDHVTLCPIVQFSEVLKEYMDKDGLVYNASSRKEIEKKEKVIEKFRQGAILNYHLLNKFTSEYLSTEYKVVSLKESFTIPFESFQLLLRESNGQRLRLQPPYREHLSQAFARNFMRIGLPVDIKIAANEV